MDTNQLIAKHKNKILHAVIIIFALIMANNLYKSQAAELRRIQDDRINEDNKNEVLKAINRLEVRMNLFRKNIGRKDEDYLFNNINILSKETGIKILSIKPDLESRTSDYTKIPFILILKSPGYHAIGLFISKLENSKDVFYVVESLRILPSSEGDGLNANLKINSVAVAD